MTDIDDKLLKEQEEAGGNNDGNGNGNVRVNSGGNGNGNGNGSDKGPRLPIAEKLVDLVTQNSNIFFRDQYGTAYANIKTTDHHEIVRVESSKFKRHLIRLYYESEKKVANAEAVSNAVQVLYAKAEYEGNTIPLSLRVALYNGDIYYDLTNDKWQSVKITKDSSWSVVEQTPTPLFDRYNHHIAQAFPSHDYDSDEFERFIDLAGIKKKEDRILIKVYIVSLFIPGIQHVILQVYGEQGGAKSMLETLIKELVDPAKPRLLSVHKDRMEFIQQLAQNHLVYYDNLKYTPSWLSDEVCRAVTGTGSSKRKLYTDSDAVVYEYMRCPGFNGINLVLTEPDALDRSIIIERERIKEEDMIEETKIKEAFYELRPRLLGYIFDILSKTLQIKPAIELKRFSRMGDFTIWGEAIARAMGYKDYEFIEAYADNRGKQNIEAIENSALGQAVARLVNGILLDNKKEPEEQMCWYSTTSRLLEKLNTMAYEHNINTGSKAWPKAVNSFTKKLKIIQSNVREGLGFDISITRITTGKRKGVSSVKIWKIPSPSSPSSPDQDQAQNDDQNGEDTKGSEDTNPHQADEPSPEEEENRAQNGTSEGSEGSEDTFQNLTGAGTIYRLENSDIFAC